MCIDAEERFSEVQKENKSDGLAFKNDKDPRITRIGSLLRRLQLTRCLSSIILCEAI